ncbi:WD40-repeat-containing domain protein [Xylariaceae sp. FL0804]|nr:WD40-repeat-containing domain protein [Xylariaceae sp. FL0804]
MVLSARPPDERFENRRPRSSQTTVSVKLDESDSPLARPRIKFGLAECIETKTVTTTTTTKRSYPPLLVRQSRPLSSLDAREFPLAQKPTPPELASFTFDVDDVDHQGPLPWAADSPDASLQLARSEFSQEVAGSGPAQREPRGPASKHHPSQSSSSSSRRAHRMTSRAVSPAIGGSVKKGSGRSTRSQAPALPHAANDRLRRAFAPASYRSDDKDGLPRLTGDLPITPDTSELAGPVERPLKLRRRSHLDSFETPDSEPPQSQSFFDEIASPAGSDSHTVFSSNVATPPITDADADVEPFADADESLQQSIRALHHPRPVNSIAAQDASLPSPRLSPTLQAAQLSPADQDGEPDALDAAPVSLLEDSQNTLEDDPLLSTALSSALMERPSTTMPPGFTDTRTMLESFDTMPDKMKSFMMYQFLRRCPRKTLHMVAEVVRPALSVDMLRYLPPELSLHVLSYLDHQDLCRAAQVSKHWRGTVDSNETGWKELLDRDGFVLATGELDRAIREGWGWQDPFGPEGCERDLSLQTRLTSTESELRAADPSPKRSSKRKRGLNSFGPDGRQKRRALAQHERAHASGRVHKSEGPISAASAAAAAVPDPHIGLPSLRQLHLFKSLYRRHHQFRQSWTSGKVKPAHVAFAAHPRRVITCLQFDDDKIITGSDDMMIHVYETKSGRLKKKLEGHEGGVWALQYEGNVLVSGSTDRSVRVWDIEKGLCTQVFYGHTSTVRCLQILMPSDTGRVEDGEPVMVPPKPLIITGSRDSQLRVWRLPEAGSRRYIQTGPPANDADCPYFIRTLSGHSHSVRAIAAHADTLVSGSYDNTVRVWRISTGEVMHTLQGHSQKVYSVVLDVKRNRCISGSMDSFVKIWDLDTGACLYTLQGHTLLVGLLDLRDDRLVSAAADSTLRIWEPDTGRCMAALTAHTGAITCFQHDGRKVISGSDQALKMWDTRTGQCLQDLLTDLSGVWQVRFDERRCVAAVQRDNLSYIEILDFGAVRDGKPVEELGKRVLLNGSEVQRIIEEDN